MRTLRRTRQSRSLVVVMGAVLVVAGAGLAAARTMTGPQWTQQLLAPETEDTTEVADAEQRAADVQAFFDAAGDCGPAALGDADLADQATLEAYASLVDALDGGQVDHMVNSVRVLLANCEAHANDGLANALYHHGLNWARHYEHEVWLEQKFADRWPDGKPGGGHAKTQAHGGPGGAKAHGNPHDADPTWSPGGGHAGGNGNGFGHTK